MRLEPIVHMTLLLAALLACKGGSKATHSTKTDNVAAQPDPQRPADPPMEKPVGVRASDLIADYKANEVRGDAKWRGKLVATIGYVGDIRKDFTDSAYITLKGSPSPFDSQDIHCKLQEGQEGVAGNLTKGETVILQGRVSGMILLSVILGDCKVAMRGKDIAAAMVPAQAAAPAPPSPQQPAAQPHRPPPPPPMPRRR